MSDEALETWLKERILMQPELAPYLFPCIEIDISEQRDGKTFNNYLDQDNICSKLLDIHSWRRVFFAKVALITSRDPCIGCKGQSGSEEGHCF